MFARFFLSSPKCAGVDIGVRRKAFVLSTVRGRWRMDSIVAGGVLKGQLQAKARWGKGAWMDKQR